MQPRDLLESLEAAVLLAHVGSALVAASFDTGAALLAGEDPATAAGTLGSWIRAVQATDLEMTECPGPAGGERPGTPGVRAFCAPAGQGIIDLPGVIRGLRACGYCGSLNAKIDVVAARWRGRKEEDIIRESVRYLREASAG
jgi:sugar phosphate isomerase/epimerase